MSELLPIIRRQRRPLVLRSLAEIPVPATPEPAKTEPEKTVPAASESTEPSETGSEN